MGSQVENWWKIAFGDILGTQVQIEDLRFKCCILGKNLKITLSGRTQYYFCGGLSDQVMEEGDVMKGK